MKEYESLAHAANDAFAWFTGNRGTLPEQVVEKLGPRLGYGTSPVDAIVGFTEAAFANLEAFDAEGKQIAAGCAQLIDENGFHGRMNGRAAGVRKALLREAGEKAPGSRPWPAPSEDPEPSAEFAKRVEAEAPAPPAR